MRTIIIGFISFIAVPCFAQWRYLGNIETIAMAAHDTSFFFSDAPPFAGIERINPNGEADAGINFSLGTVSSFASLGRYIFANIGFGYSFRSSDNGNQWEQRPGGKAIISNGRYLFARYQYFQFRYMAISRDSGNSWDSVASFDAHSLVAAGNCIFASTGDALWRSLDTGSRGSWTQLSPQPPFMGTMMTMGSLLFMYQNYRAAFDGSSVSHNGVLIISRDSGMIWDTVQVDSAGMPEYVTTVATDGKNLFVGGVSSRQDPVAFTNLGNGFYVSTDTGKNWRAVNDGLGNPAYDPFNVEAIGIYVHDSAIYISTNNNNYGGSNPSFAGYYRPLKEVLDSTKDGVKSVADNVISDSLSIYPNPLSGITTISLTGIPFATVEIYDLLGREVEHFRMAGSYEWNASRLPAGTYYLEIETPSGLVVRKLVKE